MGMELGMEVWKKQVVETVDLRGTGPVNQTDFKVTFANHF